MLSCFAKRSSRATASLYARQRLPSSGAMSTRARGDRLPVDASDNVMRVGEFAMAIYDSLLSDAKTPGIGCVAALGDSCTKRDRPNPQEADGRDE